MDEASSALDTETEDLVYQLILQELPESAIVSVAHRENVAQYHKLRWQFVEDESTSRGASEELERKQYTVQYAKPGSTSRPVDYAM
jgi:putative ATP-binding cassette transporter